MKLFYFESRRGVGVRSSVSKATARREILEEVGTHDGIQLIREATKRDIAWVQSMGGYLPELAEK